MRPQVKLTHDLFVQLLNRRIDPAEYTDRLNDLFLAGAIDEETWTDGLHLFWGYPARPPKKPPAYGSFCDALVMEARAETSAGSSPPRRRMTDRFAAVNG